MNAKPYKGMLVPKTTQVNSIVECISLLSKSFELKTSGNEELQQQFFKLASIDKRLPPDTNPTIIDLFIGNLVTIISSNYGRAAAYNAFTLLFTYLKNDEKILRQFYPTKELLMQLNVDKYLTTKDERIHGLILNFLCFLFMTYDSFEYSDIVVENEILEKIRKMELRNVWKSIKLLIANQEALLKSTKENQTITSNAFTELFMHIETIKDNSAEGKKGLISTTNEIDVKEEIDKISSKVNTLENEHARLSKKLIETTNAVEEVFVRTNDIISMVTFEVQLSKDARDIHLARLAKLEGDFLALSSIKDESKSNETQSVNLVRAEELTARLNEIHVRLRAIEFTMDMYKDKTQGLTPTAVLVQRLDDKSFKEVTELIKTSLNTTAIEINEMRENLEDSKSTTSKLKEIFSDINRKHEELDSNHKKASRVYDEKIKVLYDNIEVLISEVKELKKDNSVASPVVKSKVRRQNKPPNIPKMELILTDQNSEGLIQPNEDLIARVDHLEQRLAETEKSLQSIREGMTEINDNYSKVSSFNTNYYGLQELREDCEKKTKELKGHIKKSADSAHDYLQGFTDMHALDKLKEINNPNIDCTGKLNCLAWLVKYHKYITHKSFMSIVEAFRDTMKLTNTYERVMYTSAKHFSYIMSQLINSIREPIVSIKDSNANVYLIVLELAVMNDQNLETGLALGLVKDLIQCVNLFCDNNVETLNLAMNCLVLSLRNAKTVDQLMDMSDGLETIMKLLNRKNKDEATTSTLKVLRVCLRSDKYYEKVVKQLSELYGILIKIINSKNCNKTVGEAIAVLKNYTRKAYVTETIEDPNSLSVLCSFANAREKTTFKMDSIGVLKNCCKTLKLLEYIKKNVNYKGLFDKSEDHLGEISNYEEQITHDDSIQS